MASSTYAYANDPSTRCTRRTYGPSHELSDNIFSVSWPIDPALLLGVAGWDPVDSTVWKAANAMPPTTTANRSGRMRIYPR